MIRVLIVDDDDIDRLILIKLSEKASANSIVDFGDPSHALTYLQNLPFVEWPSHIFVDINMPKMNGFQFIEALIRLPDPISLNNIFIGIVTSSELIHDRQKSSEYNCIREFISKPLTFETLQRIFDKR
jgi:CheY-like chemotaxis protein